jgi:hypothetical protein
MVSKKAEFGQTVLLLQKCLVCIVSYVTTAFAVCAIVLIENNFVKLMQSAVLGKPIKSIFVA